MCRIWRGCARVTMVAYRKPSSSSGSSFHFFLRPNYLRKFMKIILRVLWLSLLGVFSCFSYGQTTINTTHPNNNGNGSVTFNIQNTNAYDITITEILCHLGTSVNNNIQLLYRTSPFVDSAPPWSFGVVGAGQNGWTSAGTGVVANSNTANGIVTVLSSLNLIIPAGATYQLGLSATTMQYSTLISGAGVNSFSGGGVNILTGDGISWGGPAYPSTPANYPRGLIGGIKFVQGAVSVSPQSPVSVPVLENWLMWLLVALMSAICWRHGKTSLR